MMCNISLCPTNQILIKLYFYRLECKRKEHYPFTKGKQNIEWNYLHKYKKNMQPCDSIKLYYIDS